MKFRTAAATRPSTFAAETDRSALIAAATACVDALEARCLRSVSPAADAGGPYTVREGSSVVLDASGSHAQHGSIVSYK